MSVCVRVRACVRMCVCVLGLCVCLCIYRRHLESHLLCFIVLSHYCHAVANKGFARKIFLLPYKGFTRTILSLSY